MSVASRLGWPSALPQAPVCRGGGHSPVVQAPWLGVVWGCRHVLPPQVPWAGRRATPATPGLRVLCAAYHPPVRSPGWAWQQQAFFPWARGPEWLWQEPVSAATSVSRAASQVGAARRSSCPRLTTGRRHQPVILSSLGWCWEWTPRPRAGWAGSCHRATAPPLQDPRPGIEGQVGSACCAHRSRGATGRGTRLSSASGWPGDDRPVHLQSSMGEVGAAVSGVPTWGALERVSRLQPAQEPPCAEGGRTVADLSTPGV